MLDARFIAERRRSLGLTRIDVAAALRTSRLHVDALEDHGRDSELRVRDVVDLAQMLSCKPADLIDDAQREPASSAQQLGALLAIAAPAAVSDESVRERTGWTRSELDAAVAELGIAARACGQAVIRCEGELRMAPDPAYRPARSTPVGIDDDVTRDWDECAARTLWAVIDRVLDEAGLKDADLDVRQTLRLLLAKGHVVMHLGAYRPSDQVIARFQLRNWEPLESLDATWSQGKRSDHES